MADIHSITVIRQPARVPLQPRHRGFKSVESLRQQARAINGLEIDVIIKWMHLNCSSYHVEPCVEHHSLRNIWLGDAYCVQYTEVLLENTYWVENDMRQKLER